jgi:hypothetical protein
MTEKSDWERDRDGRALDQDVEYKKRKYLAECERYGFSLRAAIPNRYTRRLWDGFWSSFM